MFAEVGGGGKAQSSSALLPAAVCGGGGRGGGLWSREQSPALRCCLCEVGWGTEGVVLGVISKAQPNLALQRGDACLSSLKSEPRLTQPSPAVSA